MQAVTLKCILSRKSCHFKYLFTLEIRVSIISHDLSLLLTIRTFLQSNEFAPYFTSKNYETSREALFSKRCPIPHNERKQFINVLHKQIGRDIARLWFRQGTLHSGYTLLRKTGCNIGDVLMGTLQSA